MIKVVEAYHSKKHASDDNVSDVKCYKLTFLDEKNLKSVGLLVRRTWIWCKEVLAYQSVAPTSAAKRYKPTLLKHLFQMKSGISLYVRSTSISSKAV